MGFSGEGFGLFSGRHGRGHGETVMSLNVYCMYVVYDEFQLISVEWSNGSHPSKKV